MRNRAKCKLCSDVIESLSRFDHVSCKCLEISISGGKDELKAMAKSWYNFLRVDDDDNVIVPRIIDKTKHEPIEVPALTKQELLRSFDDLIGSYEQLPNHAKEGYVTHYDMMSALLNISMILKCKD